jgi:hypothetical protein
MDDRGAVALCPADRLAGGFGSNKTRTSGEIEVKSGTPSALTDSSFGQIKKDD